jgi:hypothetical protein
MKRPCKKLRTTKVFEVNPKLAGRLVASLRYRSILLENVCLRNWQYTKQDESKLATLVGACRTELSDMSQVVVGQGAVDTLLACLSFTRY